MLRHNGTGVDGRDANGRFTKGNRLASANPFGRHAAGLRQSMVEKVNGDAMQDIMEALIAKAKEGNVSAAKLVLQYVIGKPTAAAEPDRVDVDEWELRRDEMVHTETIKATAELSTVKVASRMVDELRATKDEQIARHLLEEQQEDAEDSEADDCEFDDETEETDKPQILPLRTVLSERDENDEPAIDARPPISQGREIYGRAECHDRETGTTESRLKGKESSVKCWGKS